MLTNTDITLFKRSYDSELKHDVWTSLYIPSAWWYSTTKSSIGDNGIKQANVYACRVADLTIDAKINDIVVKGATDLEPDTVKDFIGLEYFNITSVTSNQYGPNKHIKLGGV